MSDSCLALYPAICLHNDAYDLIAQVHALRGPLELWQLVGMHCPLGAFLIIDLYSFPRRSMETAPPRCREAIRDLVGEEQTIQGLQDTVR